MVALTNEAYPPPLAPLPTSRSFPDSPIGPFAWTLSNSQYTDRIHFEIARITIMFMAIPHLNRTLPTITPITRTIIIPITITITPLPTPIRTPTLI